jgi:hypothetical protein
MLGIGVALTVAKILKKSPAEGVDPHAESIRIQYF